MALDGSSSFFILILSFVFGAVISGGVIFSLLNSKISLWKSKFELEASAHQDLKQHSEKQQQQTEELQKKITLQFENLAHKIFNEKNQLMQNTQQAHTSQLLQILSPLENKLKDFEKKVEDTYSLERSEKGLLRGELNKLIELNQMMSKEASLLVRALKGEQKTQGTWGEIILENILENSGLRKNEEYLVQETLKNSDNEILRPDIMIKLPDQKHLIVDSKMTLVAFEKYSSAENEIDKKKYLDEHIDSLKKHVQGLSDKKYYLAEDIKTPDFVILFLPLEPAFSIALQYKSDVFEWAWSKNIAISSPTTLYSTLKTVATLWKQDRQQKNALEIAKRGGELYDKFAGLLKDFDTLGDRLNTTQKSYQDIQSKLYQGRGNLISQVEKLKELGAKADKSLPSTEI